MAVVKIGRIFAQHDSLYVHMQDDEAHPDGLMSETADVALATFVKAHHAVMLDCALDFDDVTVDDPDEPA